MRLVPQELSAQAFAPYGRLIDRPHEPSRLALDEFLACDDEQAPLGVSMSMLPQAATRFEAPLMERHPHSVQAFVPVDVARYVVAVALGGDAPDLASLCLFVVHGHQGVAYGRGVWHLPMHVLDRPGVFVVLMHSIPPPRHEEWHRLREPLRVEVP